MKAQIYIPDDIYAIERMLEEGHWDRHTYNRLAYKRRVLMRKRFGPLTTRQQLFGFRRGRVTREQESEIRLRSAVENLLDEARRYGYNI